MTPDQTPDQTVARAPGPPVAHRPHRWVGLVRAVVVMGVGAGLVVGASRVPGVAQLAPVAVAAAAGTARERPVATASLTCPGPETEGVAEVPAASGTTTVYAATAPREALGDVAPSAGAGRLQLTPAGNDTAAAPEAAAVAAARGGGVRQTVSGATSVQVSASGSLAPGAVALQTWLSESGDQRALVATPCLAPRADLWLVGGGGETSRRERIVLVNPGANTVTADVSVLGTDGELQTSGGRDVAVPPRGRTTLVLDALVGAEATPVVHVTTTGGTVAAVLSDSWVDGAVGRGSDDAVPSAAPSTEQVIPAAAIAGPAMLRIAVPGEQEAVVQTRLLTADGPRPLPASAVVRVPGRHVIDIDLSALPAGRDAIQVRADQPVVAGLMTQRRAAAATSQSDFAWTTSTPPISAVAGTLVPPGLDGGLTLAATGAAATATVTVVSAAGAVTRRAVTVPADSTLSLPLAGPSQVWVTPQSGTLRAGVDLVARVAAGAPGPLYTAYGLPSAVVTATQVPVRRIG